MFFQLQKNIASLLSILIVYSVFPISASAQIADHIVISELVYGNINADDEFIELYNPTDQAIDLVTFGLKLHIRNSTGSSDSNKSIQWNTSMIPAYGFFLFASKNSPSYATLADATYSPGMVSNGAVYISLSSEKLTNVIDFIAWDTHSMPIGFESQKIENFSTKKSIERKSSENEMNAEKGNAWDTDNNDFLLQDNPYPQNSNSAPEKCTLLIPDTPSNVQDKNISSNGFDLYWENNSNTSGIEIALNGNMQQIFPAPSSYTFSLLNADTDYTVSLRSISTDQLFSPQVDIHIHTLALPLPESDPLITNTTENPQPNPAPEEIAPEIPPEQDLNSNTPEIQQGGDTQNSELPLEPEIPPIPEISLPPQDETPQTSDNDVIPPVNESFLQEVPQEDVLPPALLPFISEIYPEPHRNESEWIELYNPANIAFTATGTQICREINCIILNTDIAPKSFLTLTKDESIGFSGTWFNLSNSSGSIIWKKENGESIDQMHYQDSTIGMSFVRQADGSFSKSSHVTKNIENTINTGASVRMEIQGAAKTNGYAPLSVNVRAYAYDNEQDPLQFLWNFGNGVISTKENPESIHYETPGDYIISLKVFDGREWSVPLLQNITVLEKPKSSGGGGSNISFYNPSIQNTSTLIQTPTDSPHSPQILFSRISMNDSFHDWIELQCIDCNSPFNISGFSLSNNKVFFEFPNVTNISSTPLRLVLSKTTPEDLKDNEIFIEKKTGLTKTDGQLILRDNSKNIFDAICWNNFDSNVSQTNQKQKNLLHESQAWNGGCIDSRPSHIKDSVLVRTTTVDANTKEDWTWSQLKKDSEIILETPKKNLSLSGLQISEIFINPQGNDKNNEWIELENTLDTPVNTEAWTMMINKKIIRIPTQNIAAKNFFIIGNENTFFSLKNNLGNIELFNPYNEKKDGLRYGTSNENMALAREDTQYFSWTKIPTKESKNIIWNEQTRSESDSDVDGIPDGVELQLGTNPQKKDSDGDKIPDQFEIEHFLNPQVVNHDFIFRKYLAKNNKISMHIPEKSGNVFTISGQTEPFANVTLAIHSQLQIASIQADIDGKWKYYIPKLEQGLHRIDMEIQDINGIHIQKSNILQFNLPYNYSAKKISSKKAKKQLSKDFLHTSAKKYKSKALKRNTTLTSHTQKKQDSPEIQYKSFPLKWAAMVSMGSFITAGLVGIFFLLKKRRSMLKS